ncbi:MAG: hypothetical protein P4L64_10810 [Caulobacteraceae bacterium]|nr:hypothetical protein [Caulobacteraceae bacterium]
MGRGKGFLLSFGVCGALAPGLKAGDLILGDAVIAGSERWTTNADWTARLAAALPGAQRADVAASDAMIGSVADKEALYRATGAKVVDMESHIAARIAARHGLAFAVVRAVSDAADHTLPAAALAGLRPDGQPDITAVLWSLAKNPAQLPALLRTAREAEAGFRALERAAGAFSAAS